MEQKDEEFFFLIFNFARVDALSFWLVDEKKWKRMRKYMFFSYATNDGEEDSEDDRECAKQVWLLTTFLP